MAKEIIRSVSPKDDVYPIKLKEFLHDISTIYYKGDLSLADKPSIAVVGSRDCTAYGRAVAVEIGRRASCYGVQVVSGLAKGIDGAGHAGALESGGKTIGVVANGLDIYYPQENRKLQDRIGEEGLLISEYPEGVEARHWHFPTRNRIISALADAVIVVEANTRSGSLITAECAIEQGKEVYAVPGNIMSQKSLGTNKLISIGARPLVYVDEVFQDMIRMGIISHPGDLEDPEKGSNLGSAEKGVISVLKEYGELPFDDLAKRLKISISELNGIVSVLEIKGLVFSEMGKIMIAKSF